MSWLALHWLNIIQTAGIVGGLFFTGCSLHRDRQARRSEALFRLTEQHRELWQEALTRDELSRVLREDADLAAEPLSREETAFVTLLFLHLNTAYSAIEAGVLKEPEGLTLDIQAFFSLPVPRAGWEMVQHLQDREFVAFIEGKLRATSRN